MADITLISGSTLGSAEYVAEHLAEKLEDAGFTSEMLHGPMLDEVPTEGIWLVISSTHGAGDIPDNLLPLYEALREHVLRRDRQAGCRTEGLRGQTDWRNAEDQRTRT